MNIPINLDVAHAKVPNVQAVVVRQGETGSTTLKITVNEAGKPYDLTGCETYFLAVRPDMAVVSEPCVIEQPTKGTISYTLPSAISCVAGNISLAYVEIRKGTTIIATTDDLAITVRRRADMTSSESGSVISEIDKLKELLHGTISDGNKQLSIQQTEFAALSAASQSATTAANTAAKAATSAAGSASDATTSANTAKDNATKAAELANTASLGASASKTAADDATIKANAAAKDATAAAEEARGSISPDKKVYVTYDTVGDTDYLTLIDTEA